VDTKDLLTITDVCSWKIYIPHKPEMSVSIPVLQVRKLRHRDKVTH
jgi:hypothetical protein